MLKDHDQTRWVFEPSSVSHETFIQQEAPWKEKSGEEIFVSHETLITSWIKPSNNAIISRVTISHISFHKLSFYREFMFPVKRFKQSK